MPMTAEEIDAKLATLPEHVVPAPQKPAGERGPAPIYQISEATLNRIPTATVPRPRRPQPDRARTIAAARAEFDARIDKRILAKLRATPTPCVLLLGPTGIGKTSALHWLRCEFGGAMFHARELGSCERRHGLGDGYPPELDRIRHEAMVCIDDVGAEDPRDLAMIQEAIETRYRNGQAMAVTSGLTKAELLKHLGAAYARRLLEQHVMRRGGDEWPVLLVDLFS